MEKTRLTIDDIPELKEFYEKLPPSYINNSRKIFKNLAEKAIENPAKYTRLLNAKFGFDFDYKGYLESDWGPEKENNHE